MFEHVREAVTNAIIAGTSTIVIGKSGCGKSTLCEEVFLAIGYNVLRPCYESYVTHRDFEQCINNFFETSFLDGRSKLLFLDDVDVLLTNNRLASTYLLSVINKRCVVMTTCTSEERRCSDLKKNVLVTRLDVPGIEELVLYFSHIHQHVDKEKIRQIVCDRNCNIRCICNSLSAFHPDVGAPVANHYFDTTILETAQVLFHNHDKGINDLQQGIASDPVILSYILFDNYKKVLQYATSSKSVHENMVGNMFDNTAILSHHAYITNDWNLTTLFTLLQCATIRYIVNTHMRACAMSPCAIGYTQIPARSAQHYNTIKAKSQSLFQCNMTSENHDLLSEVLFETNAAVTPCTPIASYISNICSKSNMVYKATIITKKKKEVYL